MQPPSADASQQLLNPTEVLALAGRFCVPAEAAVMAQPNTTSDTLSAPTGSSLRPPGDSRHDEEDASPEESHPPSNQGAALDLVEQAILAYVQRVESVKRIRQGSHEVLRNLANDWRRTITDKGLPPPPGAAADPERVAAPPTARTAPARLA